MAVDRFTRFKSLRELWRQAKQLLARFYGPKAESERMGLRWQQVRTAQRLFREGQLRGTGDPDSYLVPPGTSPRGADDYARQAHMEAQRAWARAAQVHEWHQRQEQLARHIATRRG
jgi:hypothetical protein